MQRNRILAAVERVPTYAWYMAFAVVGLMGAMGQAPIGLPLVSLLGFATAFALFSLCLSASRRVFWFGWAFGLGYFLFTLQWLVSPFLVEPERYGWIAPIALFAMSAGLSLFWGAAFALAKRLRRPSALIITLALAEMARAYVLTGFPWGMPAYGLVDSVVGQSAAWFGSHGLNLLFFMTAWCLCVALLETGVKRRWAGAFAVTGIALILWPAPPPMDPLENAPVMRLVQPNAPQHEKWDPDHMPIIFDRALSLTAADPETPLEVIVWPETALPDILNYGEVPLARISSAAGGVPVVVGANRFEGARLFNAAAVLSGKGQVEQIYDKHHLVPFGEYIPFGELFLRWGIYGLAASDGHGFSAGPGPEILNLGAVGKALPLICYEVVFPQYTRQTDSRPDLLLQITNDAWFGNFSGPYQHLVQAQMRAIESGLPVARVANTGVSAMIDARGRIVEALPLNTSGYLDVQKQRPLPQTLYAWTGDGPIFALFLLVLCVFAVGRPANSLDLRTGAP